MDFLTVLFACVSVVFLCMLIATGLRERYHAFMGLSCLYIFLAIGLFLVRYYSYGWR